MNLQLSNNNKTLTQGKVHEIENKNEKIENESVLHTKLLIRKSCGVSFFDLTKQI